MNFKNNHLQSVTIFKAALVHQNSNMTESVCCQFVIDSNFALMQEYNQNAAN